MKKKNVFKWWGVVLILSMCSVHAEAQDLKSVLTGVAKAVIGNKATTAHSIVGTWTYQAPECQFESDQLLAKAGGVYFQGGWYLFIYIEKTYGKRHLCF